jgi:hypothetical protein
LEESPQLMRGPLGARQEFMTSEDLPATGFWTRLLRGGVVLLPFEGFLLRILEQHVPGELVPSLRRQWRGLNLIQRSPDWQELRFYRLVAGRVDRADLPKLSVRDGEVKLFGVTSVSRVAPTP